MPTAGRPDVDVLEGLTTTIIVDQERMGTNARSTVGTVTTPTRCRGCCGAGSASRTSDRRLLSRSTSRCARRAARGTWTRVGANGLRLGQPLTTLSGGERQRLKLATHMGEAGGVYVLDEPTTGLHLADLEQLLALLDRLVDSGKSVIVIEHHLSVMAHGDWIIDLGPGAGHDGGKIVFEGTPAELVAKKSTLTGEHLAAFVATRGKAARAR
jgi:excinuclease UvrABC ATPase subunit